jgi:hypothetical protein
VDELHASSICAVKPTVMAVMINGFDKNTNIGPNQRACSSAFGIPKLSEFNPAYGNYYFSPFPQPLGLWERRAAWCKPTVPSN